MSEVSNAGTNFDTLYGEVKALIETGIEKQTVEPMMVLRLMSRAMITLSRVPTMSGPEKKDLVVSAVTAVLHDLVNDPDVVTVSDSTRDDIDVLITLLPSLIDLVVTVGKVIQENKPQIAAAAGNAVDAGGGGSKSGGSCCTLS